MMIAEIKTGTRRVLSLTSLVHNNHLLVGALRDEIVYLECYKPRQNTFCERLMQGICTQWEYPFTAILSLYLGIFNFVTKPKTSHRFESLSFYKI